MELQASPISPQADDAQPRVRQNLGLDGPANGSTPLPSNDPLKAARQAIRSQVTAREYTERQLAQAQGAIQDLRNKLRHVHQERETAVAAAQSAMAAKDAAERSMRAAEAALATERATRVRTEGMLRDAEATIRDLREKLANANQNLRGVQSELDAERQASQVAGDDQMIAAPDAVVAPIRDGDAATVRRPVGRPRKVVTAEEIPAPTTQSNGSRSSSENDTPSNRDANVPGVRRPVGRPRKTAVAQPVGQPGTASTKPSTFAKAVRKVAVNRADDQEPIQWWVDGWKGR